MAIYAFVDKIDASPTVILDLDNDSPLRVLAGVQNSPSKRRVSSLGSSARNGSNVTQMSYGDGDLSVPLDFKPRTSAEQQAETIQALVRILDGGSWLMWQPKGVIEPVFYRVKYGQLDIDTDVEDELPDRTLTLSLVVEYAAYGLPVTGTATIANDPTAATNPMSYVFPDIQGDVASSLVLTTSQPSGSVQRALSVVARNVSTGPFYFPLTVDTPSGATGWTVTDVTDAAWVGGTKRRSVKASGSNKVTPTSNISVSVPPGDYRVYLRAQSTVAANAEVTNGGFVLTSGSVSSSTGAQWHDLGVGRFPYGAPLAGGPFGAPADSKSAMGARLDIPGASGTIDINGLLLMPLALDGEIPGLFTSVYAGHPQPNPMVLTLDGIGDSVRMRSVIGPPYDIQGSLIKYTGASAPAVVPGKVNTLTAVFSVGNPSSTMNNTVTGSSGYTWTYYPRYLYIRPASS